MRRIVNRVMGGGIGAQLFMVRLALLVTGVSILFLVIVYMGLSSGHWPSANGDGTPDGSTTQRDGPPGTHGDADGTMGPLRGIHVVVDAGHGGHDRGACHFPSALIEKEINLDMALRLESALRQANATVSLTRRDDTFLTLDERAQFANERNADLFISLHVNRYPSSDCFGAQTFYLPTSEEGRRLALLIQEELRPVYPANYRQALPGDFRVLRHTQMAAALVEIGFVTSPVDRELMAQSDYRDQVAASIVKACIRFVRGELPAPLTTGEATVPDQTIRIHA